MFMRRFLGGSLKLVLLLAAAIPLLWITQQELVQLQRAFRLRLTAYCPAGLSAPAPHSLLLHQGELIRPVIAISPHDAVPEDTLAPGDKQLAAAIRRHSAVLGDIRQLLVELHRLQRGSTLPDLAPFPADHPYASIWQERHDTVELESRILHLRREQPEDIAEVKEVLGVYRERPASDPEFHLLMLADAEGYELRFLSPVDPRQLLARYFADRSDQAVIDIRNQLQVRLDALEGYLRRYDSPDDYVIWAKQETQQSNMVRELIRADQVSQNLPFDQRLAAFARFVRTDRTTSETDSVVRQAVHALCESQLDPSIPLDTAVHVLSQAADQEPDDSTLVPRHEVIVVWNDHRFEWFEKTGFDEYTLPVEKVHRLILRKRGTSPPRLQPTPRSEAAHCYTLHRQHLKWTPEALDELKRICEPHKEHLGAVWKLLLQMSDLARRYEALFPSERIELQAS